MGQFLLHGSVPPSLPPALLRGDLAEGCILRGAPTCSKLCPCPPPPLLSCLSWDKGTAPTAQSEGSRLFIYPGQWAAVTLSPGVSSRELLSGKSALTSI